MNIWVKVTGTRYKDNGGLARGYCRLLAMKPPRINVFAQDSTAQFYPYLTYPVLVIYYSIIYFISHTYTVIGNLALAYGMVTYLYWNMKYRYLIKYIIAHLLYDIHTTISRSVATVLSKGKRQTGREDIPNSENNFVSRYEVIFTSSILNK